MDNTLTLLVDAPSLFYRALFSTPDTISTPEGAPINAAYGFFRMLAQLIGDRDPDYIGCAADGNWRPEWRVELIDSYKSSRAEPGSPQEQAEERLAHQVPAIYELLESCGIGKKMAAALLTRYGTIEAVMAAAESGETAGGLAKVRRELDYVRKAVQVVTIAPDVPLPAVDLTRPREVQPEVLPRAAAYGLESPIKRLVGALTLTR